MNSIGSVIPVNNDVKAAAPNNPPTALRFSGLAHLYIANAASGKPNIMNGNLPAMKRVVPLTTCAIVSLLAPTKSPIDPN